MAATLKTWIILGFLLVQSDGTPQTIYDKLQPLGCGQFLAILNKCGYNFIQRYRENQRWTVFAPNDTAFDILPPARRSALLSMTQSESEDYIESFTLGKELLTTYFRDNEPERTLSARATYIFLGKRVQREGNSASGTMGTMEYYANGALILKPNEQAGQSIIHMIDRVLEVPSDKSILGYISLADQPDTTFYNEFLKNILDPNDYASTVDRLNRYRRLTVFIPTKAAMEKIPRDKKQILLSNRARLAEVVRYHIIMDKVIYTSFVYHNEGHRSAGQGQVIFRTSKAREAVYVNSGKVTAQITHGNITCENGALHFIDTLLGYVYNSARDEIELSPLTQ